MSMDSLYGNLLGGPSPAPAQAAPAPAEAEVKPEASASDKRSDGDDIFAQAANALAQPANAPKADELRKEDKKEPAAPAALPQIGQSFSAAKLMMPPVRKKVEASKKPMPALDISKLQEEKEALLRQRAAAQNPKSGKGFSPVTFTSSTGGGGSASGVDDMAVSSSGSALPTSLYGSPDEEYDPAKPNDYDEFCRRRMRIKAEEEMERRRQEAMSRKSQATAAAEPKEESFAEKMMKKMGHKPGEGLGKDGQGMATPLVMQKTSAASGQVVPGQKREAQTSPAAQAAAKQAKVVPEVKRPPSRVLLLMNLVGAGEVDEDLQEETAEEAGKYGKVVKCSIQEMKGLPDEQAVRIFLEFSQVEEATKAYTDMNGRYFGGRVVKARFYDADKFAKGDLTSND